MIDGTLIIKDIQYICNYLGTDILVEEQKSQPSFQFTIVLDSMYLDFNRKNTWSYGRNTFIENLHAYCIKYL